GRWRGRTEATPQQPTLFDEAMRQTAEQATWRADVLRADLHAAEETIEHLEAENARLRQQVQSLEKDKEWAELRLAALQGSIGSMLREERARLGAETEAESKARLVKALTQLTAEVHPDRWQGSPVAEELTKRVLALRDTLTHPP